LTAGTDSTFLFIYLKLRIMLGKLFKRKKELKPSNEMKVAIIEDSTDNLYTNFGITDERRNELIELTLASYKNHSNLSKSYEEIVAKCKHVNEVIVCVIIFERKISHSKELSALANLIGL
jgi:hypothetical protein